ncbi:hypothetical protein HDV05_006633, partial [Chytridiales sp. JEL 0842]
TSEKTLKKAFKVFVTHIITSALPTYGDLGTINGKLRLPDTDTSAPKTLVEIAQLLNNLVALHGQKVDYESNGEGSSKGSRGNIPYEIGGPRPDDDELTYPGHRKPVEHTWAECKDKKTPWVKENISKYMEEFRAKRVKKAGAKGGDDGKDVDMKVSMKVGELVEVSAATAKAKRARLEEVQELDSGASHVMSNDKNSFSDLEIDTSKITLADDTTIIAEGKGTYTLNTEHITFEMSGALYAPKLGDTLISVNHLIRGTGNWIVMRATDAYYVDTVTQNCYPIAKVQNGTYKILLSKTGTTNSKAKAATKKAVDPGTPMVDWSEADSDVEDAMDT